MTTRLMKSSAIADTFSVERARKPTRPAAKPAAPRKRAPAKRAVATAPPPPPPPAKPAPPHAARDGRRRRLAFAAAGALLVVAASFAAGFLFLRGDDNGGQSQAAASFASSHEGPVYWAGPMTARSLELSTTSAGTFVRYVPLTGAAGGSARTITVATYPLRKAYATAAARAKNPQMTSRKTARGGLVVWSLKRPTSVYVAFPGVPQLVEVYAPDAEQARSLVLSGRIRPVH